MATKPKQTKDKTKSPSMQPAAKAAAKARLKAKTLEEGTNPPAPVEEAKRQKQALFLADYRKHGIVAPACRKAGIDRGTYNYWCQHDPGFVEARDEAQQDSNDVLVEAARTRALGYEKVMFHQGVPTYKTDPKDPFRKKVLYDPVTGDPEVVTERVYSEKMLTLMLQARVPGFRPKELEANAARQGGVLVIPSALDPESWERSVAELAKTYDDSIGRNAKGNADQE